MSLLDEVHSWLIWARNYGEIESFRSIASSGRRWLIILPDDIYNHYPAYLFSKKAPNEIVLTSREALVFGIGCAVGGQFTRPTWTQDDWEAQASKRERAIGDAAPFSQMAAALRAGSRVRGGYSNWLKGAPTHVLAEFLNELGSMGWELRKVKT